MNSLILEASTVIGHDLRDQHGKRLGTIEDLLIDLAARENLSKQIVFALVGLSSANESRFVVIPWEKISVDMSEGFELVVDAPEVSVRGLPSFERERWPNFADPQFHALVRSAWVETRNGFKTFSN